jgi:hypothetical protein
LYISVYICIIAWIGSSPLFFSFLEANSAKDKGGRCWQRAQVTEHLTSKCETLITNLSTTTPTHPKKR